jgi:hypothetical protein
MKQDEVIQIQMLMKQDEVIQMLKEVIDEAQNYTTWTVSTPPRRAS